MNEKSEDAAAPADGPIVEKRDINGRTITIKHYTAEHSKPSTPFFPNSAYSPGFVGKGKPARECPKCGFHAFGWSSECSKCGETLVTQEKPL